MNENILVTIIIPVYNVEDFLDKTVHSAISQTYKNIEIILVDDGSTDSSGTMCDQWKLKDSRILVIHKTNGGLSSARNAALDICKGSYIFFLDSDDYISEDTIRVMLDDALKINADIVEAPLYYVCGSKRFYKSPVNELKSITTKEAIRYDVGAQGGAVSSCSKLFKREIFNAYRFREGKLSEDHYAIVDILSKADIIAFEPKPFYYYVHRNNSITTQCFSEKMLDDLEAAYYNYKIIETDYPDLLDVAEHRIDLVTFRLLDRIMKLPDWKTNKTLIVLINNLRKNKKRILKSIYFGKKRKIAFAILLLSPTMYHFIRNHF